MARPTNNSRPRRTLAFEVRRSGIHGRGGFATRRIKPGTRIVEYAGQRIDAETADARYDDDAMDHHHTFLFEIDDDTFVDAGRKGNEARFINHSCDPNCATYIQGRRIYIEAVRNIQPGVELTYDYSFNRDGPLPRRWRQLYACRCGAENCRGTMLAPKKKRRKKPSSRRR